MPPHYVLALTAPGSNSTVTSDSVSVGGGVSPVPPPGATAAISVNGVQKLSVALDGAGKFAGSVPLDKRIVLGDVQLTNPSRSVRSCGNASTNVLVGNSKSQADVTNVISVTVTGAGTPL